MYLIGIMETRSSLQKKGPFIAVKLNWTQWTRCSSLRWGVGRCDWQGSASRWPSDQRQIQVWSTGESDEWGREPLILLLFIRYFVLFYFIFIIYLFLALGSFKLNINPIQNPLACEGPELPQDIWSTSCVLSASPDSSWAVSNPHYTEVDPEPSIAPYPPNSPHRASRCEMGLT